MTVDELTSLCEALLVELKIDSMSFRGGPQKLKSLGDDDFLSAVRFAAGERVLAGPAVRDVPAPTPRRERAGVVLTPEQVHALVALDEEDVKAEAPAKQVNLGDGVFLGFD